jgi:hypothetical protein
MRLYRSITLLTLAVVFFASAAFAQTKRRTRAVAKKPAVTAPAPAPGPVADDPVVTKPEPKKNERPVSATDADVPKAAGQTANETVYHYEFFQPDFFISRIVIDHDEAGKGTITFTKRMFSDTVTDPLQLSPAALERINAAYTALNFLDASENYQYEKNYSHLGVSTIRLKRSGKQRTSVFNYTVNKDARAVADEYRKLGNQFIWIFDITVSRENQPLESPKLLDSLDGLMRRNEISDPVQMLPLLKGLADDERLPLIARNHARKLVERIEKKK